MRHIAYGRLASGQDAGGPKPAEGAGAVRPEELVQLADSTGRSILMAGVYDSVNPPAAAEQLFYDAAARLTAGGRPPHRRQS